MPTKQICWINLIYFMLQYFQRLTSPKKLLHDLCTYVLNEETGEQKEVGAFLALMRSDLV